MKLNKKHLKNKGLSIYLNHMFRVNAALTVTQWFYLYLATTDCKEWQ